MTLPMTTRGFEGYAAAALAGALSAAMFAFAVFNAQSAYVFLAYFAAVPLFFAGLGGGTIAGLIASLGATASLLLTQNIALPVLFFMLNAMPVIVLTQAALRHRTDGQGRLHWYPEGLLLTAITFYPCITFLIAIAATFDQDGGLLNVTTHALNQSFAPLKAQATPDQLLAFGQLIDQLARYIPSLFGMFWIFITSGCLILAQRLLTKVGKNLRTNISMHDVYVPNFLVYVAMAAGLLGAFAPLFYSYIGINLFVMLCVPFFFVGLGIIHAWAETKPNARLFILIALYVSFITVWPILLVILLGVPDQWINFRRRMVAGSPTTH